MALRIPSHNGNGSLPKLPASPSAVFLASYANLTEFLSSLSGEGNSRREPGTLSVSSKDGKWTLRLKDPSSKVYCFVVCDSLDEGMLTVEVGLGDGSLDWRADKPFVRR